MATPSEVKAGLDEIAQAIRAERDVVKKVISNAALAASALDSVPAAYADVIGTIGGYAADTTNPFEQVAKAELDKLTAEFIALKGHADGIASTDLDT